jgi:hypothetical protein
MANIDNAKCSVPGCKDNASVEVILYDVYRDVNPPIVFFEQDFTCPYLCKKHWVQNEKEAKEFIRKPGRTGSMLEDIGNIELVPAQEVRRLRGAIQYPFSNKHTAQGFTVYRPLKGEIQELLNIGDENQTFERKASMLYDYKKKQCNDELKHVIAKSVAGFMNKDGGTLLIGVRDDRTVLGLEKDYECLKGRVPRVGGNSGLARPSLSLNPAACYAAST